MKRLLIVICLAIITGCGGGGGGGSDSPVGPSEPVTNVAGTYSGTWHSADSPQTGSLAASITQSGSIISGTINIGGSACVSVSEIKNATISGNKITWYDPGVLSFDGTIDGNTISGTYVVTQGGPCYSMWGNYTLTKI